MKVKQVQLAQQLGISKSYLSMILSGQRKAPESICSQLPVNFQAKLCLEGSRSIQLSYRDIVSNFTLW